MKKNEKISYYSPIDIKGDFIIYMKAIVPLKIELPEDSEFPFDVIRGFKKDDLKYIFRFDKGVVDDLDNNIPPSLKIKGKEINWDSESFEIWEEEVK